MQCRLDYNDNHCQPSLRPPALEEYCQQLERCLDMRPEWEANYLRAVGGALAEGVNKVV